MIRRAFDPVVDARTRVLILGSLPGEASLAAGQYYAHPRNAFWPLMDGVTGRTLSAMAYQDRLQCLQSVGVGLWDVIASAERSGSLDSAIRSPEAADLRSLVAQLPLLQAVAFNGGTAMRLGSRILEPCRHRLALIPLPSSSPAHARPLLEKAAHWSRLRSFLIA
ncbi:DNA-deoxyinosine glycosylase [Brevundimonas variabilis]|uniref:Hypoxanthine-DNA glycosylase n=1 Tax=Brevundimonas variabilis TaxID=74312 RepID=A0A7W9CJQ9_9CAUL|nr:DNA-deoxyinosine glycosylase [Brevundimonas variabilis]MBB5746955.1 hypoxanthine-DNA glycosylase [Brevundimonas variabilis]